MEQNNQIAGFYPVKAIEMAQHIRSVIQEKIPEGLIVSEHTDTEHYYRHTKLDLKYGSSSAISGILKAPHLMKWGINVAIGYIDAHFNEITPQTKDAIYKRATMAHEDIRDDAADIGTIGHGFVDDYLTQWIKTGEQPNNVKTFVDEYFKKEAIKGKPVDYRGYAIARSAEKFCNDFNIIPVASELKVFSAKHRFAGTLDHIALVRMPNGKYETCLVDWKTSNSIEKVAYVMQTVSYQKAFEEMTGIKLKHVIIVRLDKKIAAYDVLRVKNIPVAFKMFKHCQALQEWGISYTKDKLEPMVPKQVIKLSEACERTADSWAKDALEDGFTIIN